MNYTYTNILIITSLALFPLAIISWFRRKSPGALELAFIIAGVGIWSLMYSLRWMTDRESTIFFWLNMSFTGIVIAPTAMFLFALRFTQPARRIKTHQLALLAVEPILTLILLWTDSMHGLFFGGIRTHYSVFDGGIWLWFNIVYSFCLIGLGILLLLTHSQQALNFPQRQARMIAAGYLIPIITCVIDVSGLSPIKNVDLTPFFFTISGFLVMYGFFYHHLLDITPVAYSKLIETSPDGIVVLDASRRIIDLNPTALELLATFSGSIGQSAETVFASWPGILSSLNFNEGSIAMIQMNENTRKDFQVSITPLVKARGESDGYFLVFHEITFFKQTERALAYSEKKIRSLFLAIPDVVIVLDRAGRYLEIAPTQSGNLPSLPMQLIGKTIKDVFPETELDLIKSAIHDSLESGILIQLDYPMTVRGQKLWFAGNVSPLTKDTVIWIARDITDRKNMEQMLQENRTRLEMAQTVAQVGSWEFNLETMEFWASDEYYRIMGMDPSVHIGSLESLSQYINFVGLEDYEECSKKWVSNMTPFDREIEILLNGETEPHTLHLITSVIKDAKEKPYKASGAVQDITVQKRAEKALEKRMLALTRPLDHAGNLEIEDLFNLEELQKLQDDFAYATGVASLITRPDGTPITKPSNYSRLCGKIIRTNETGAKECEANDAKVCLSVSDHSNFIPCQSIGLMHAGAPIRVGGQLIAIWLIGQVRTEDFSLDILEKYIERYNLNRDEVFAALEEIPVMTNDHFSTISQSLFTFSSQLSNALFQNVQQARFISEHKKAEEDLRSSENKLRSLFKAMTDVIIIYDSKGYYREIPPTGSQRYFRPLNELINRSISEVMPPEISSLFLNTIHLTLESKETTRVDYSLNISGIEYWFSANVSPLTSDRVIWVARDITDRKKAEENLQYQSLHDILTGLYNRQYYETEIDRLQHSRVFPISILVMDVDGLKWVNDHHGHNAGDELLKRVAVILKSSFRPEDMVARMGGDEFVVVLPETGESAARQAVDRLEKIIQKHNELFPPDQSLGLSIGYSTGGQGILLTEVFKMADQSMYLKKNAKKELAAQMRSSS